MIHTIRTLPILTFFDILKNGDLYLLLKNRSRYNLINKIKVKLFKLKLDDSFNKIVEGYKVNDDDLRFKKIESLQEKIDKLVAKYQAIMVTLEVLKYGDDEEMRETLKGYGYEIRGDYYDGLHLVYKQVENLRNKIEALKVELQQYIEPQKSENTEGTKIEEVIISVLVNLGLSLKINDITVIEYIHYRKALEKKIKAQQQSNKK